MACAIVMLAIWKILLELLLVMIKGSHCITDIDVAPVSLISDGIVPLRIPILTSAFVRWEFSF